MICMRWLQGGKEISKQGRLMLSAGKPPETPDRQSQSPSGAVLRTYSSARGIHVARQWQGGEWRARKNDGRHRWGWWITARQGESVSNDPTRLNNKLMHPQSNAESPDQAQWPKIQINPIDSWSSQPSNSCTTWPHQINHKKWKACPEAWTLSCCNARSWSVSRSKLKKDEKGGFHGWQKEMKHGTAANCSTSDKRRGKKRKKAKPGTAASCSTNDKRQGEKWKNSQLFHFT